jgi:hypothetical protein
LSNQFNSGRPSLLSGVAVAKLGRCDVLEKRAVDSATG